MKRFLLPFYLGLFFSSLLAEEMVILDEAGVRNLRIETVEVEEAEFESTIFALGRLDAIPSRAGVVSSRIPGRIVELLASPGDTVSADQVVARVESRQPGNPPPVIEVRAPISGMVTKSAIRLGEPIEPDKVLFEIMDLSELYAIACLPEDLAGKVHPGAKAHIAVAALPGRHFEGEMLRFGVEVEVENATLDAIFVLKNESGLLRPGMRSEFSIVTEVRENVMRVPREALQGDSIHRFLYVKHFDIPNAFVKATVTVGEINDREVEIISGLFPADEVVVRGGYSLSFAGQGSGISLKEALDAAHGHEHAEDGSELTPEQRAERERSHDGEHAHDEGQGGGHGSVWRIISIVLFVLLIASLLGRKRRLGNPEGDEPETVESSSI